MNVGLQVESRDSGEELDAVWTPDGNAIVFVASTNRDAAAYANTNTSLFKVSASGGEPVRLTTSGDNFGRPAFRPDGKALYAGTEIETDNKTYHLERLAKFSWPNMGQPEILTARFDRSVGSFAFTPDSKSIYLTAEEAGNEKLYTMPADGGEVTLAMDMTRGVYTNLKIPAKASSTILIANWESAINPPEDLPTGSELQNANPAYCFQRRSGREDRLATVASFLVHQQGRQTHS